METPSNWVVCDGCGLPASPEHVAERVNRLEIATQFRPIHINVLFVALAPSTRLKDDFYGPPESREFFDRLLQVVEIPISAGKTHAAVDAVESHIARLAEFQRRGYYVSYLSECPISAQGEDVDAVISRLYPTLMRRIKFNYKPRQIVILGTELSPLGGLLAKAGIFSASVPVLEITSLGDPASSAQFRAAMARPAPDENLPPGYGTIVSK